MITHDIATALRTEAARVIVGQDEPLTQMMIALFCGGHVLLEGVPGTAKTLMAKTLAMLVNAEFKRVQFTPDLMPSDVIGTQVFEMGTGQFRLHKGPVFTNILLGDEINRAPAKTQSALLEAMEERQVTIEGQRLPLPEPFFVLATQNPIEYEGAYPLPEAQLDRFLFKVIVDYAPQEIEIEVLRRYHAGFDAHRLDDIGLRPVMNNAILAQCRAEIRQVQVDDGILKYITDIAQASRKSLDLMLGGSPRASISLLLAAKTWAAMQNRAYVIPDDVKLLVRPVYRHRIILKPEAEIEGLTPDTVMARILARVDVPR
ncbi:AAA family ATPase [Roseiflexus castenholzii]|uniref:ATPase associated with various cellular activities AAA_3 n=1 Tax=Roseiflexus castenholzii (strain DSM 13941 / HLO8) TaxID=383372 RepID=A7NM34_ROSCS|nr:MoxR family ATPase [Roseiflexus castenholzii]ABU58589.1 ATPase associated with various cellular activities AAA_3 [Roseiflexus castenholzii DSM 13941]